MRPVLAFLPALAVVATAAPLPFPCDRTKPDLKAMQGEWKAITTSLLDVGGGRDMPKDAGCAGCAGILLTVAGDRLTIFEEGSVSGVFKVRLDGSRYPGKLAAKAHPQGAEGRQRSDGWSGRYWLEGDTLTVSDVDLRVGGKPLRLTGHEKWFLSTTLKRVKK